MDQDDGAEMDEDAEPPQGESDRESDEAMGDLCSDDDNATDIASDVTATAPCAEAVLAERRRRAALIERSQEELDFPDEVDTPLETPARERFQKFRGLKSYRTSPWDPYEELPIAYSRIWEFESFNATANHEQDQFAEDAGTVGDNGVSSQYCALYLKGVPADVVASQPCGMAFVLSNLFNCERKVTVMHSTLSRLPEYSEVIKSKQDVTLHCGFRRLPARPIFSEIPKRQSACKKFRFQRFFQPGSTACVSLFAPAMFTPCPVLMFVGDGSSQQLAAWGSVTGADPKRLVIKRAILTGYPVKTHKSKAVVRFMFFSPEDIAWFKPVELHTKKGLRGHIKDSRGTHGYMKCQFNNHVKQDDTVCMALYKRVYPKWHPPTWGGDAEDGPDKA